MEWLISKKGNDYCYRNNICVTIIADRYNPRRYKYCYYNEDHDAMWYSGSFYSKEEAKAAVLAHKFVVKTVEPDPDVDEIVKSFEDQGW